MRQPKISTWRSARLYSCLERLGVDPVTLEGLSCLSKMCERDIRKLQNVGNGTYAELQALCEQKGITIGAEYVAP